jgi:hypothetical protein
MQGSFEKEKRKEGKGLVIPNLDNKKNPLQADGVFWTLLRKAWQNQTQFSPQGVGY